MTDERFQEQATNIDTGKLVDIIKEMSFARKVFPEFPVGVEDRVANFYKVKEHSGVQTSLDLSAPNYSSFATEKVPNILGIHQADLAYDRHDLKRAARDILPVDSRQRLAIEEIVDAEEKLVWAGKASLGITSVAEVGTNSTTTAVELDLGTFIEAATTFNQSASQLRNLLKNKFQGSKIFMAYSTDVDDRAKALPSTTSEHIFAYDFFVDQLGKMNGGNGADYIIPTNYLGAEAGDATLQMAMIASDPRNIGLWSSELEVFSGATPLGGLEVQMDLRSTPAFFRGASAIVYHATCVLAP